jgi:Tol biopolymer transport system component
MQADGSHRRFLGSYGRPHWSPDGRQFLIVSFSNPREVTLMDVRPEKSGPLQLLGQKLYSMPSWVAAGTIVAVVGPDARDTGDTIALIDVSDPGQARVKEVLWKKGDEPDVTLYYPILSAGTRRCIFARAEPKGMALYSFFQGRTDPPKRLEPEGYDRLIAGTTYSPDGRYVLFSSNRPDRAAPGPNRKSQ